MSLAGNKPRTYEMGRGNELPVKGSSKIYEGGAVGAVVGTGLVRALNAADYFAGFAEATADNSSGADSAINCRLIKKGQIQLAVTGAVITDIDQPVYATDDDTFTFLPVAAVFIGFVKRFVSAGIVVVDFDTGVLRDPYGNRTTRSLISTNTTVDATYCGSIVFVDTDAVVITLPAVAAGVFGLKVVNIAPFGTTKISVSPNASDSILGPGITAADDKDLINTKATAKRGDFVVLDSGDADGYLATELVGTWAREA